MREINIDGKTFGLWTVIGKSDKPRYVKCKCACGKIQDVRKNALMRGDTLSCKKCVNRKIPNRNNGSEKRTRTMLENQKKKYIGTTINGWKILDLYKKEGLKGDNLYCKAICPVCGKEHDIRLYKLKDTEMCLKCKGDIEQPGKVMREVCDVEGTNLAIIKSRLNGKVNKNSKTGYNGVVMNNGKYAAYIIFKGKRFYLGTYSDVLDAANARKRADELIYGTFLNQHVGWEEELKQKLTELKKK